MLSYNTMRFNTRRTLLVSFKVWAELLRLLEVFTCFLNSVIVLDSSSAVLVMGLLPCELQQFVSFQTQLGSASYHKF